MPMVLAFVVLVLQAFLSAGHYPGHSYYRGLSSIPRECQGRFPQLTNYTYDGSELTVITVYPWNFNQVEAANLSGEIHTAFQGDLLMNPNDYGQLVHLDFHGSLDFEAICSFPSSGGKRSFECTSENMSYIMEFRIRDFQPKRCVARSLEIVGVRGTPDNNMSVQDALVNYPSPVLSFPRKRSSLACLANAVSGSEGSNGSNGYHNYHPSGPSSPKSYGYDIYDRYGRKRYGNWKKWNKNWWRASGRGNLVEEASDVSTNVSTCGTPRLNGVILEIVGTVAAIDGPVNVAGKATFLQFDELGQLSSSGKFVQAKMELSQIGRTRLAQRQLFMCVLREQESEGSMLCNNQFLNLLGGAVFIGVTPANACVPAKLQFFAQYRFLQETTYGPAYGESLDFPGLTDCNGGFPKVLNVECNFTADGGTELGYLVTQEFLRLEFQGDFNGTASENGRFVRTSSYANESTYCAWERGNTLSCIFGQTCIVLRGSVAADSQCSAVEYLGPFALTLLFHKLYS
ncbi:unnamed protein product [Symbiodinium natans]|uniref:Uncharacterized protein n=1 Tax=Symbiodinium natans TaxID=878477 RepID=A0A812PX09_9DINO|nr:unnamed protein product [Symbiodinium natans]